MENSRVKTAEELAKEKGEAFCVYCGEEIWYNADMGSGGWTWESEYMLGWCDKSPLGHRHRPR